MKIAILGNGKMGRKVNDIASKKGHIITCKSDSNNTTDILDLSKADVAIDFSTPNTAFENICHALNTDIPVISGTTGWLDRKVEIEDICLKRNGAFLYSSNFSIGANLFFQLNKKLAELMNNQKYKCGIEEIHHTEKIDIPSGTALKLKEDIETRNCINTKITSQRIKNTTGIHKVNYTSINDEIEIKHTSKNRNGFAEGAIIAAEWIIGKKGIYSMKDVIYSI